VPSQRNQRLRLNTRSTDSQRQLQKDSNNARIRAPAREVQVLAELTAPSSEPLGGGDLFRRTVLTYMRARAPRRPATTPLRLTTLFVAHRCRKLASARGMASGFLPVLLVIASQLSTPFPAIRPFC
jgi:hypothetical protein